MGFRRGLRRRRSRAAPDWGPLLAAAGLDPARLEASPPQWAPSEYVDTRATWRGTYPDEPKIPIVVEAGSFGGRATWLAIHGPWNRPEELVRKERTTRDRVIQGVLVCGIFAVLTAGSVLAFRNSRLGRGDRVGARRVSKFAIAITLMSWVFSNSHSPIPRKRSTCSSPSWVRPS